MSENYCKYYKEEELVSFDSGATWTPTGQYRKGALIETESTDCGYVPPQPNYFKFVGESNGTVVFTSDAGNMLSYSRDNGATWIEGNSFNLNAGETVMLKGTMWANPWEGIGNFTQSTGRFRAEGNILSLLFADACDEPQDMSYYEAIFCLLFYNCASITSIELTPTTLWSGAYAGMFMGCTSLNYIKCLATDISADSCTYIWVQDVPSGGTFECPSSTPWSSGDNGIPNGWTRVNA